MATMLTPKQVRAVLVRLGWETAAQHPVASLKGFQVGWNLGPALEPTGRLDQATSDALRVSYKRAKAGQPTMSAHFSYVEFRCKDGGKFPNCRRIWVKRAHVRRLESYRAAVGGPIRIVSGCRCTQHSTAIGGASASQHMFGVASDVEGRLTVAQRRRLALFAGPGFKQSTGKVIHVDSRDRAAHNLTSGTPTAPTTWKYAT